MDDKDYITRFEYEERQKRIDDEDRRQNHRIDKLETITDQIAEMATSIETNTADIATLEADVSQIKENLQDLLTRVTALEG